MATETLELVVRTSGTSQASSSLRSIETSASSASRSVSAMRESLSFMRSTLVALSFIRVFDGLIGAVSTFQNIANILRIVTINQQQTNAAMQEAGRIAVETRSNLESTARLMYVIASTTKALNLDWKDISKVTEVFQKSTALSGLDPVAAKNSMKDFLELLDIGVVQGRQFRALLMQDRPLIDAIATTIRSTGAHAAEVNALLDSVRKKGQNVSGGYLFDLTQKFRGAFTASDFVTAMQTQTQIGDQFARTQATVSQQFEVLKTKALLFFGALADGVDANKGLGDAIRYVADNLEGLSYILGAVLLVVLERYVAFPLALWFISVGQAVATAALSFVSFAAKAALAAAVALFNFGVALPEMIVSFVATVVSGFAAASVAVVAFLTEMTTETGIAFAGLVLNGALAFATLSATLVAMLPEIAAVAAVFAVVGVAIYAAGTALIGFLAPLAQLAGFGAIINSNLNGPFSQLHLTLKDIPAVFAGLVNTLMSEWPLLMKLMSDMWSDMISGMMNRLGNLGNEAIQVGLDIANPGAAVARMILGQKSNVNVFDTGRNTTSATGDIAALSRAAQSNITAELLKASGFRSGEDTGLTGKPVGAGTITNPDVTKPTKINDKYINALKAFDDFIGKFSPLAKLQAVITDAQTAYTKAVERGVPVQKELAAAGLTWQDVLRGSERQSLGFSNAQMELTSGQKALNIALKDGSISAVEYKDRLGDLQLKALELDHSYGAGVNIALLKFNTGLRDQSKIAEQVVTDALAQNEALNKLAVGYNALTLAVQKGDITTQQYTDNLRKLQIAYLDTQTDSSSGFVKGMLQVQQTMQDTATLAASTVTDAFNNLNDTLSTFFATGKLNAASFFNSILQNLDKLAVQSAITGPLANLLGFTPGQTSGTSGLTGFLSSIFGGSGALPGVGGTSQLGGSAFNPMYVSVVTGSNLGLGGGIPGGATSGAPGGADLFSNGGLFSSSGFFHNLFNGGGGAGSSSSGVLSFLGDIGSLFGFAGGGDFAVGGTGGTDSQLVAFRASPDERVSIKTPAQQRAEDTENGAAGGMHLHLHGVQDYDSFKRSKSQIAAGFEQLAARTRHRNGGK